MKYDRVVQGFGLGYNLVGNAFAAADRRRLAEEDSLNRQTDRSNAAEDRKYRIDKQDTQQLAAQNQLETSNIGLAETKRKVADAQGLRSGLSAAYADNQTSPYQDPNAGQFGALEPEAARGLRMDSPDVYGQNTASEAAYAQFDPERLPELQGKHKAYADEGIIKAANLAASGDFNAANQEYNSTGNHRALWEKSATPGMVKVTEPGGKTYDLDPNALLNAYGKPKPMIHARPGDSIYNSVGNLVSTAPYPEYGDVITDPSGARLQQGPGGVMKEVVKPPASKGYGLSGSGGGKSSAWIQKQDRIMEAYHVDKAGAVEIAQMLESNPSKLANYIVESKRRAAASAFESFDEVAAQRAAMDQVKNTQKELGIGGMVNVMQRKGTPDPKDGPSPAYMEYIGLYNKAIKAGHADIAAKITDRARAGGVVK